MENSARWPWARPVWSSKIARLGGSAHVICGGERFAVVGADVDTHVDTHCEAWNQVGTGVAPCFVMSFSSTATGLLHALLRRGARRRLVRLIPVVGVVFAAVHVRRTVRAKGPMHGSVDAALDLLPIVGPIKAVAELLVGDLIGPRKDPAAA